jgi:glycine cleavage system aminomethyltransferase T
VTSAAYGHTLGRAVAMGYVEMPGAADPRVIADAKFELGDRRPAVRRARRPARAVRSRRRAGEELIATFRGGAAS